MSPDKPARNWRAPAAAALGGVVFALSAPPTDFYPAVSIGLGLLFVSTQAVVRVRAVVLMAMIWATSAGLVGMRFVPSVIVRFTDLGFALGLLALFLLSVIQSGTWAIGLAIARVVERRTGLDSRAGFGLGTLIALSMVFVIAWTPAGLVSPWPVFVQLAELIGEKGVSFLIAVSAALFASPLVPYVARAAPEDRRPWLGPALGALLLALMAGHGALRMRQVRAAHAALPTMKLGVVQAAVEARLRWQPGAREQILARLRRLSVDSERGGAELTIWPEAAYPFVLDHAAGRMQRGRRAIVGGGVRGPVLFGLITTAPGGDAGHNATTVVSPEGLVQVPQAKMELLWFGETVPFGEHLPFLRKLFSRAGGLIPGKDVSLLSSGPARIGVLNCYEDTLPAVSRKIAKVGPNLLVNVTNDAWFGPTAEPELHLRLSALRAVETRLDLVRAVNLGVPAWIDASGAVRVRGAAEAESVMHVTPALSEAGPTVYVRFGDTPLWIALGLAMAEAYRRRRVSATRTP
ncbi:MAG: apolipoprotein N-acyltransferase [Myxococcales bacterium]|nr:apolipoprotein N-acyltransferase [Myxococcales bacterium]